MKLFQLPKLDNAQNQLLKLCEIFSMSTLHAYIQCYIIINLDNMYIELPKFRQHLVT